MYNLAVWVCAKVLPTVDGCSQCSLLHQDRPCIGLQQQASLVTLKSFGGLNHLSLGLYLAVKEAEYFFRGHDVYNCSVDDVVKSFSAQAKHLFKVCKHHPDPYVTVMTRFLALKMRIRASFITEQEKLHAQFASKDAAARTTIK